MQRRRNTCGASWGGRRAGLKLHVMPIQPRDFEKVVLAMEQFQRLRKAASLVPGLKKQWMRADVQRPCYEMHRLVDGQVQDIDDMFFVPNAAGGLDEMMHPHDPNAPPAQIIGCSCWAAAYSSNWPMTYRTGRPLDDSELRWLACQYAADDVSETPPSRRTRKR